MSKHDTARKTDGDTDGRPDNVAELGADNDKTAHRIGTLDAKLASGIERASDGAHASVTALEERSRAAIEAARHKADEARRHLEHLEREAAGQVEHGSDRIATLVREKPLQAAGIAFAAGVLTTLLLRRR